LLADDLYPPAAEAKNVVYGLMPFAVTYPPVKKR